MLTRPDRLCGPASKREGWILGVILAGLLCFYCLTLRAGHVWGDDFAHYIMQAENLARFDGITAKNYIVNPDTSYLAPQVVPPGLSVVLAPVIRVWGLNFHAMKVFLTVLVVAAWGVFYFLCRLYLSVFWSVAAVFIVAMNGFILDMRDSITPEKPYYLFSLLTLYCLTRAYWNAAYWNALGEEPPMRLAAPLGILLYCCYATRNLAASLIVTVFLFDILRLRRVSRFAVASIAVAGLLGLVQTLLLATASGYGQYFSLSPKWVAGSALSFLMELGRFWFNGYSRAGEALMAGVSLILAALGAFRIRRTDPGLLYLAAYGFLICAYFAPGYRFYLYPLFPLVVLYMLAGLNFALDSLATSRRAYAAVAAAFLLATALTYAGAFRRLNWGPITDGISDPDFQRVCAFVQAHTSPSDVFLFFKPRAFAMETGRRCSVPPMPLTGRPDEAKIWSYARRIGARYLLVANLDREETNILREPLDDTLRVHRHQVSEAFSSGRFVLYRLNTD